MRPARRALALLAPAALLALAGCANMDLSQGLALAKAAKSTAAAVIPISLEEEIQIGRAVSARVAGRYGLSTDDRLTRYVSLVGLVCAANSERPGIPWRFAVLASDEVNAFAAPGGYIFITRGALRKMTSEAQLAGVLSHEIAHVAGKHILKEIQKANLASAGKSLAEASGKIPSGVLDAVADTGANVLFKGYSRSDEYEADLTGTTILHGAGYPPDGLVSFLGKLESGGAKGGVEALFATHPATAERVGKINAELKARTWTPAGRPYLEDRFRRRVG
jgi:predicted Zn-dependent protease